MGDFLTGLESHGAAQPPGGGAFLAGLDSHAAGAGDDAMHALRALASSPAGHAAGEGFGKIMDILSRPGVATESLIANGPQSAGNAFIHGLDASAQQATRDTVKSKLNIKDLVDKLPEGLPRGLADAAVDTALDPTTYLGGAGLIEKGVNTAGKAALFGGVKGALGAQDVAAKVLSSKPMTKIARFARGGERLDPADIESGLKKAGHVGGSMFDFLTPKGEVTRKAIQAAKFDPKKPLASISAPFQDVARAATIKGQAQNTLVGGSHVAQSAYDEAIKGLPIDEERDLYHAMSHGTEATLSPELQKRAAALRSLYDAALHLKGTGTVKKELGKEGFTLPEIFKPYDTQTRGIFNTSNVRRPYLPHGARYAAKDLADIKGDASTGIGAEDLLGAKKAPAAGKAPTALDASDPNKLARLDTSQLQDVVRQREINRAYFRTTFRAIAAKDAARALAKAFGTEKPIMKTIRGEKPDTGEIYRAAVSGLNADDARVVGMLSQGAKPEDVAKRVYGDEKDPIAQNLQQRAQTIKDVIAGGGREEKQVPSGRTRMDFSGVPGYIKESFQRDVKNQDARAIALRGVKRVTDAPKYGFFGVPFRHMANVATMGALADPRATALATGRFALAHPEATGAVAGGVGGYSEGGLPGAAAGAAAGALGGRGLRMTGLTARAAESQARAIDAATKAGAIAVNPDAHIPGFIQKIPGIGQLYGASNRFLWDYENAVRGARQDSLVKRGIDPQLAAQRVNEDLMNYGDKSALTKNLSYVAPFASYRSKLPGVVARGVARNPERALMADRVAPALVGEDQNTDDGGQVKSYLPLAEVLRGARKPEEYLRSMLGYPSKDAIAAAHGGDLGISETLHPEYNRRGLKTKYPEWMIGWNPDERRGNTVKEVLPSQLAGSIPGMNELLSAIHMNPYAAKGLMQDLIEGASGVRYLPYQNR